MTTSSFPILCLLVAPLVIGLAMLAVPFRLGNAGARRATRAGGVIFLGVFFAAMATFGPYAWALHLEAKWHPADPGTMADLESHLSLYSRQDIPPATPGWGMNHQLQPGERMTRYLLLWNAPLDVVYTGDDRIVKIYTSYE